VVHSSHRFEVRVSGKRIDVAEVSGAAVGFNDDGKPAADPVILRRAIDTKSPLVAWWQQSLKDPRRTSTVQISLLNAEGKPAVTWRLTNARAVRWEAPTLDAATPAPAMEELHLAYRTVELSG